MLACRQVADVTRNLPIARFLCSEVSSVYVKMTAGYYTCTLLILLAEIDAFDGHSYFSVDKTVWLFPVGPWRDRI